MGHAATTGGQNSFIQGVKVSGVYAFIITAQVKKCLRNPRVNAINSF